MPHNCRHRTARQLTDTCRAKAVAAPAGLFLAFTLLLTPAFPAASNPSGSGLPADASQLAREILQNEVAQQDHDQALWTYQLTRQDDGTQKTYIACQTDAGEVRRLVAINGKPLSSAQQQAEDKRVRALLRHPGRIRESHRKEQEDSAKAHRLLKTLPDAFLFHYLDPNPDPARNPLVRLSFQPNPQFHPSGEAERVFHHMEGEMTLDVRQKRLDQIRGKLTSEVKFFGGVLGHLDRGGTFVVKQADLGDGRWEMTELNVQMNGKALLFKTIAVRQNEIYSAYHLLPPRTGPQQASAMLFKGSAVSASVTR